MNGDASSSIQRVQHQQLPNDYPPRNLWSQFLRFVDFWKTYGPAAALGGAKAALLRTLLRPMYLRIDRRFDERFDLDTVTEIPLKELEIESDTFKGSEDPRAYVPTPISAFTKVMAALPRDLREFTFIDYGAGKGRTLLLALRYELKRVIGIEFSKELCEIARRNLAMYAQRTGTRPNVEVVNEDAANYELPEGPCILYFFDPFGCDVMSIVLEKAAASYRANPRKLYFIYLGTRVPQAFSRLNCIRAIKRGNFAAVNGMIYETVP